MPCRRSGNGWSTPKMRRMTWFAAARRPATAGPTRPPEPMSTDTSSPPPVASIAPDPPDRPERRRTKMPRTRMLELLLEVSRRMAMYDSLDDVLHALVDMTTTELGVERSTLFLNDPSTNELYSRVAQGNIKREIRILNTSGIAGHVFTTGEPLISHEPYTDPRFNSSIDEQTGFVTKNVLCVPIRTVRREIIGVAQSL